MVPKLENIARVQNCPDVITLLAPLGALSRRSHRDNRQPIPSHPIPSVRTLIGLSVENHSTDQTRQLVPPSQLVPPITSPGR